MGFFSTVLSTAGRWLRHALVVSLLAPLMALWLGDQRSPLARLGLAAMLLALLVTTAMVAVVLWVVLAILLTLSLAFLLLLSAGLSLYWRYRYHGQPPPRYFRLDGREPGSRL